MPQQLFTATDAIGFSYGVTWNTVRRNIFNWRGDIPVPRPVSPSPSANQKKPAIPHTFFSPEAVTHITKNRLPHWQQGQTWIFVTWRLGDSLPKAKLDQWREEREIWIGLHPEPWDRETEKAYHGRFSSRLDEWLDQGSGSCLLKEAANAGMVADALRHLDGERYELASFVVMPNHVHVLFRPLGNHALADIIKSWKGFSAREINKRQGKKGELWQEEYWDRLIRSERIFTRSWSISAIIQ